MKASEGILRQVKTAEGILKQMKDLALGEKYQKEIQTVYQTDVEKGIFALEETEYQTAKNILPRILSEEKKRLLEEAESHGEAVQEYSAQYGFVAGVFCGFRQYFTEDDESDGGLSQMVLEDISEMPRMKRHRNNFEHIEQQNYLYEQLRKGEKRPVREYITSIECTREQRAHSASINGFYCGYWAAVSIINDVVPLEANKMIKKLISIERQLGY